MARIKRLGMRFITDISLGEDELSRKRQWEQASTVLRDLLQSIEVCIQTSSIFLGQSGAGFPGRVRRAGAFSHFFLVGAFADQTQCGIVRRAAPSAAGVRATTASTRIEATRLE